MAVCGFALLAVSVTGFVQGCGTKWRVGHLGMPQVVPGDPINQLITDTGHPQEVLWGLTIFAVAFMAWGWIYVWRGCKRIRQLRALYDAQAAEIRRLSDGR